jgi:hypothetical protein
MRSFAQDPQSGLSALKSQPIQRTGRAARRNFEDVGVDHGRGHVRVAQQLLHGADVGAEAVVELANSLTKLIDQTGRLKRWRAGFHVKTYNCT